MKASSIATSLVFVLLLFGLAAIGLFAPDGAVTKTERRKLAQVPAFSLERLMNGTFFKEFDKYSTDQFPARDEFRGLNALTRTALFLQKDSNGLYMQNDIVFKSDYPLIPANTARFTEKTNRIYEDLLKGKAANYWAAVIPDKSYFDTSDHLITDAKQVSDLFTSGLTGATSIDIFAALDLDSYYKTDTHWSQEKLLPVMEVLAGKMNFTAPVAGDFTVNALSPFYGVYWGQSALNPPPDTLTYMESTYTRSSTVENTDNPGVQTVYDKAAFDSEDSYNLFLSGGTPLTTITSPNAKTNRELVIFRDSFGSSLAPLFLEAYRKVTLVDLRYFSSALLPQHVDFAGKDVLVLYSSLILNSNIILK